MWCSFKINNNLSQTLSEGKGLKKPFAFLLYFLMLTIFSKAQSYSDPTKTNRFYEFVIECPMYKCNINGQVLDSSILVAPPHSKFTLIDMKQDICVIRFTLFQNTKNNKSSNFDSEDFTNYTYFLITKAQLDFKANAITKSNVDLVVGNVLTPLKLRFKPFDFTKDISIGTTFGVKYAIGEKKNTAVDALIGIGISTLTIDSVSSRGKTLSNVDLLAFTPSIGLVIEFGNAQIGFFAGFDFISNANQTKYEWIYKNKPWVSFGLGYSIFSFNIKK